MKQSHLTETLQHAMVAEREAIARLSLARQDFEFIEGSDKAEARYRTSQGHINAALKDLALAWVRALIDAEAASRLVAKLFSEQGKRERALVSEHKTIHRTPTQPGAST